MSEPGPTDEAELLTIGEVAALLTCSVPAVWFEIASRRIQVVHVAAFEPRVRRSSLKHLKNKALRKS